MGYGKASTNLSFSTALRLFLGLILVPCVSAPCAFANEDAIPGSLYTSARGAAMGGAFLPLADDGMSALFYNPAALAQLRGTSLNLFNISAYGDSGYGSNFSLTNSTKATSLSSYDSTLQSTPNVFSGVGGAFAPCFYTRGLAFGLLVQSEIGGMGQAAGSTYYRSLYQVVPTAGGGFALARGIVRIGYSIQWINEAEGAITVPQGTTPMGYNQGLAQGSALASTAGFALTMPWQYLPQFDLVARNIGGTHYSTSSIYNFSPDPTGAPPTQDMSIDSSLSMKSKLGGGNYWNFVFEDRDMTDTSGMPFIGRMALGAEFSLKNFFFLRGGWGSGYPSAGIGFKQKTSELSFSWYSEELGTTYHSFRDARYLFQYSVKTF